METKIFIAEMSTTAIPAGSTSWAGQEMDPATANCCFLPRLGTDIDKRVGRRVQMHKTECRGVIQWALNETHVNPPFCGAVRIVAFIDRFTNGVQANAEDVLAPLSASAYHTIDAFPNRAFIGRFKIIYDELFIQPTPLMSQIATNDFSTSGGLSPFRFSFTHDASDCEVHFSGDSGSVADIIDRSIHVIAVNPNNTATVSLAYTIRTKFFDA